MTASIIDARPIVAHRSARLAGLTALVRKDATEWIRGRRAWVVLVTSAVFMVFTAANGWIVARIAEADPNYVPGDYAPTSLVPLDNLLAAVSSQIFVVAAIFAVASLLVRERESGTLAWVASKPVSRTSIWLAKWVSASGILAVVAVIVPLALTVVAITALYGAPDAGAVVALAVGATAMVGFFAAFGLAVGTVLPGQPAVAAAGFGLFALAPIVGALLPGPVVEVLPTSILGWSLGTAMGAPMGVLAPAGWAIGTAALAVIGIRRMGRIEL
jgi:ABC-2 type transport system permease protein